ncbi:glypican-6-like [Glandiceps talaboti]
MWCLIYFALCVCLPPFTNSAKSCKEIENAYDALTAEHVPAPLTGIVDDSRRICEGNSACCTADMEYRLSMLSQTELQEMRSHSISNVRHVFVHNYKIFDEYMETLIDTTQEDLNNMFTRTYGLLFQRHQGIYNDLFSNIREYYNGANFDLVDKLDEFFVELYKSLWKLFNPQYDFDTAYMQCVGDLVDTIEPFGESSRRLTKDLKKAMLAARTYRKALSTGAEVLEAITQSSMTPECRKSTMRMTYCDECNGITSAKPCSNYCMNVINMCFLGYSELNIDWNSFLENMVKLSDRLDTRFDAKSVLILSDILISEGIMTAQENIDLLKMVFETCGTPGRRGRRHTYKHSANLEMTSYQYPKIRSRRSKAHGRDHEISNIVEDIIPHLEAAEDLWINMPRSMCDRFTTANKPSKASRPCWNGQNVGSDVNEISDGMTEYVCGDLTGNEKIRDEAGVVCRQKQKLNRMSQFLRSAYNGKDLSGHDDFEDDMEESGSGQSP